MALLKTVSPQEAEGDVKEAYSFFEQGGIPIPKPLEMSSVSPGLIKIQKQVLDYFMNHPTLGFALLSLIRYLVAKQYSYQFCTAFNHNFLKMQGMEDEDIEKLESQPETAPIEDKDKAMLLFVLKAIKSPDNVSSEDVEALHQLGWTDSDIFDAVYHGSGMIAPSYMMKAFKMDTC
jgi:hypothetical protein